MLLPDGERAIVNIGKSRDYCLNTDNPRGKGKARVFVSALGLEATDAPMLREKLLEIAGTEDAQVGELDMDGQRYRIDFEMVTEAGEAIVRRGWIILHDEAVPRLTTCFVKRRSR